MLLFVCPTRPHLLKNTQKNNLGDCVFFPPPLRPMISALSSRFVFCFFSTAQILFGRPADIIPLVILQSSVTVITSAHAEAGSGESTLEHTQISMVNQAKQFKPHVGCGRRNLTSEAMSQPFSTPLIRM